MKNSFPTKPRRSMHRQVIVLHWIYSVLIIFGALVACTPAQTPVAVPTATIIPSTATFTPPPITASPVRPSVTPIVLATDSQDVITTILETSVMLDMPFTQAIITDLADHLNIPDNRVQVVSVTEEEWLFATYGCDAYNVTTNGIRYNNVSADDRFDGLRYVLLVGNRLYEYHTNNTQEFFRCPSSSVVRGEVLIIIDPLADETFRAVQNLLANELDLSSRRVQLVDMLPVVWRDTSLGCPQDNQTYTQIDILGYHIVVTVGDELYVYHSDSNTAYPCPIEQSIIPVNTN